MAFKKIPLTIDTMIRNPVPIEGINQEDNVELNIVVTENKTPKDLSSQTIKVYVRRIDGTLVEQTDQITPTNASKGEVTVKLKNSAFNKEGYALFQLDVSDSIGRITSSYATFKVGKGLVSGEAIANTNEIEALKKVEEYIKKANQELETFKQTVAEINENEATRQENEVVRVREEASRKEAEAIRTQQEATRKEKENERVQAEIQRIADEEVRRENEALRGSKELERKQAEELRKEKELLRIADENNRKVAESKRIEAESVRVEAEKLRVVAETGRVEAESLRVTAEEERVAAETKREEGFNKFEGRISANTEELKNARTAITGETFDTLDERIDCEVDRLNKKIEVSMLQQEDKESHVVESTVEGMTTDMVVKGRTLQNLVKSRNIEVAIDKSLNPSSKITSRYTIYNLTPGKTYIGYVNVKKYEGEPLYGLRIYGMATGGENAYYQIANSIGWHKFTWKTQDTTVPFDRVGVYMDTRDFDKGCKITWDSFMLFEEGSQIDGITSYFEGIKSFGEAEKEGDKYKISILSSGKNLFDGELEIGSILSTGENDNNTLTRIRTKNYIDTKNLSQIFISSSVSGTLGIRFYDYSKKCLGTTTLIVGNTSSRLDLRENTRYVRFSHVDNTDLNSKYMISEKSINIDKFEPYKCDKKDILIKKPLREGDYLYEDNGQVKIYRPTKQYTFTGDENFVFYRQDENLYGVYFNLEDAKKESHTVICNNFKTITEGISSEKEECVLVGAGTGNVYILINKTKLITPDISGFKTWLKNNPTTIYYKLAEPIETPLNESINLKTFNERTYVDFENSIKGTSSFKAPVNTLKTIARLSNENTRLKRDLALHAENTIATDEAITDYSLDMDYKLCLLEMELVEIKKKLGGK